MLLLDEFAACIMSGFDKDEIFQGQRWGVRLEEKIGCDPARNRKLSRLVLCMAIACPSRQKRLQLSGRPTRHDSSPALRQ